MARRSRSGEGALAHPLTPRLLARLEDTLARNLPILDLVRRSPVLAMLPDRSPQRLYDEIVIPLDLVRDRLIPDVDLWSDPWLRRRLMGQLDLLMLDALAETPTPARFGIGLSLAVRSALSPAFARFDAWVRTASRLPVVITFDPVDVLADPVAFRDVRDGLRDQGYRLCMDAAFADVPELVDRATMGVDLVRLAWCAELTSDLAADGTTRLKRLADRVGRGRVVLAGVEAEPVVHQAHGVGITLFQGPWCEQVGVA